MSIGIGKLGRLGLTRGGFRPAFAASFLSDAISSSAPITYSGGANGTRVNSAGLIVAASCPRIDYDPVTLAVRGLLVEEQRTNVALQSNWPGAAAGTPGIPATEWAFAFNTGSLSLAPSIYGAGAQAVTFSASAAGQRHHFVQTFNVTAGDTVTASVYVEDKTGAGNAQQVIACVAGTGTFTNVSNNSTNPAGGAGVRVSQTVSVTGTGTIQFRFGLGCDTGVTAACSVTLSRPQVEFGAFPTSYIPTAGSAVMRTRDIPEVSAVLSSSMTGTLFSESLSLIPVGTYPANFYWTSISIGGDPGGNRVDHVLRTNSTESRVEVLSGSAQQALTAVSGRPIGSPLRLANAFAPNDFIHAANGVLSSPDLAGALPVGQLQSVAIGSRVGGSGEVINGHIRRILYWPQRLPNAILQQLTA